MGVCGICNPLTPFIFWKVRHTMIGPLELFSNSNCRHSRGNYSDINKVVRTIQLFTSLFLFDNIRQNPSFCYESFCRALSDNFDPHLRLAYTGVLLLPVQSWHSARGPPHRKFEAALLNSNFRRLARCTKYTNPA